MAIKKQRPNVFFCGEDLKNSYEVHHEGQMCLKSQKILKNKIYIVKLG